MNAAQIAHALGDARREGRGWRCRCPLHQGRSLTLRDSDGGCVLVTCWGGCDRLDVLAELRQRGLLTGAPPITLAPLLENQNGKTQCGPRECSPFGGRCGQRGSPMRS